VSADGVATTVVIADYDFGDVDIERAIVERAGFELVAAQCKTEDEVIEVARDAAAVVAQYATISARVIAELAECRVIARYGTGVDIVDVDAATRHGVLVTNVPNDWCEDEVADHALALLLAVARKITVYDRATRGGTWQWQSGAPIHRLRGSVLGLLSFGAIARAIAVRAAGFGMRITAHDPFVPAEEIAAAGVEPVSFDELITGSDCLVIQAPLTPATHHLFDEARLRRMKPTSILINTARGPIVDDRALHRALSEGWIAGAGLDDIEEEPAKVRDWRADNPLFGLDNVVVTPHAAYYSEESIATVRRFAAEEVVRVLTGQAPLSPVNAADLAEARWSRSR
jgi:D-3-phosphoglycerate dehydrogenase